MSSQPHLDTEKSSFSLTPPSPSRQPTAIADVSSIVLLPPLPPHTLPPPPLHCNAPCSSTPADINHHSTVIRTNIPAVLTGGENSGQQALKLGQERFVSGQEGKNPGQDSVKLGHSGDNLGQNNRKSGQEEVQGHPTGGSESVGSSYVYGTPNYSGIDSGEEAECLKEVLEQLERERRDLMLGNREISRELNKLDATNTKTVSTLRKLARDNSMLRHDLAAVREREDSSRRKVERSEGRVECLTNKVAVLKQALQQASVASSLNASLQQEVTRLTEDNLVSSLLPSLLILAYHTSLPLFSVLLPLSSIHILSSSVCSYTSLNSLSLSPSLSLVCLLLSRWDIFPFSFTT